MLGVEADGTWSYRGTPIPYGHILPAAQHRLNVIDGVRDEFWTHWEDQRMREARPAKLHRDFAHLTSSQALAFNVFFPLLGSSRARPEALLAALEIPEESLSSWRFEEVLDPREGTNFDAALTLKSGRRLLVEVKLTESGFGACRDDARHREKLETIYAPRLAGKVRAEALLAPTFFARYQILRNMAYADERTTVVFLVPQANQALADGIDFIRDVVLPPYHAAVRVVYLEELVAHLTAGVGAAPLCADLAALAAKYIPQGTPG